MLARSTTETYRPELPSDRRNMTGQKPSRGGKVRYIQRQKERRHETRTQAHKGYVRTQRKCGEHGLKDPNTILMLRKHLINLSGLL
jgi:hypothetical protein